MKKLLAIAIITAMAFTTAACSNGGGEGADVQAQNVKPLPVMEINAENPEDCTAHAYFAVSDVDFDANTITFTAYAEELFDAVEVTNLKAGDTITTEGNEITVETAEDVDGAIIINGGLGTENGLELDPGEGGTYHVMLFDDYTTYVEIGKYTLPMADDIELVDGVEVMEGVTVAAADLKTYLTGLEEYAQEFTTHSTTVSISDGKVSSIKRIWVP